MRRLYFAVVTVAIALPLVGVAVAVADTDEKYPPGQTSANRDPNDPVVKEVPDSGYFAIPVWIARPGGSASGGLFVLASSVGQADVGPAAGGVASFEAGFLAAASTQNTSLIFADGFETGGTSGWDGAAGSAP